MREILFRGKRKDNGAWVEATSILSARDGKAKDFYIGAKGDMDLYADTDYNLHGIALSDRVLYYLVDPETVGQYTGLTDKNGKKIFEGDILRWVGPDGEGGKVYVEYAEGVFGFLSVECPNTPPVLFADFEDGNQTLEVIGNIHDNPELLNQ